MKSLKIYSKNSFNYVNSIQSFIENKSVFGQDLLLEHGSAIDSIFVKCRNHINRLQNPYYITESDIDVLFTLDEQYAARDIFVNIAEEYKTALYNEFCVENNLDIDVYAINEGITDVVSKISNTIKDQGDKLKGKFDDLKSKIKGINEFIKELLDKGIKSVKDFLQKFEDFMINLKDSLKNLIIKIVGDKDIDTLKDSFFEQYKEALQSEVKSKEISKQFETLQNKLQNGEYISEEYICELFGLGKKEKNKDKGGNEYDDAIDAKPGKKSRHWLVQIIMQMAIYWLVTKGVAVALAFIPGVGPAIATIYLPLAQLTWSGISAIKLIKDIYTKCFKTDEFKKMKTSRKIITVILWTVTLVLIGYSAAGLTSEAKSIIGHFTNDGTLENLVPNEEVMSLANKVNEFVKKLGGDGSPTIERANELINQFNTVGSGTTATTSETITTKAEIGSDGEDLLKEFAKKDYSSSAAAWKDLKPHGLSAEQLSSLDPSDKVYVLADGSFNTANSWSREVIDTVGHKLEPASGFNKILNNMNSNAGSIEAFEMTYSEYMELAKKGCMGNKNIHTVIGAIQSSTETITHTIINPLIHVGQNFHFAGFMPIINKMPGGFKVRLGSGRTGYHLYKVPGKEYIKEVPYNEFLSKFEKLNPSAIKEMKKYVDQNIKAAEEQKDKLESAKKLSKDEKKQLNNTTKYIELFKEGKSEVKILVFCTDDKLADPDKTTNESLDFDSIMNIDEGIFDTFKRKKESDDKTDNDSEEKTNKKESNVSGKTYPLFFFNPITLCCGDLANRTKSKKPRSHIYVVKGLFSRLEFIPYDGGMSGKDIMEFFIDIVSRAIDTSMGMTSDAPCIEEKKGKFVINKESKNTGERMDFGGFTNKQITDIMNDKENIVEYMGGDYATDSISGGHHEYIEQSNSEKRKARNEKTIKEFRELLTENDKIKSFVKDECPSIYKVLYDKDGKLNDEQFENIIPYLMRIEKTYLKGDKKLSLFKKIKNAFSTEKEIDTSEVKKLSLKIASMRKKLKRQKVEEGIIDYDYELLVLEANVEVLEELVIE